MLPRPPAMDASASSWNGAATFALVVATVLTIPASLLLVWLYNRAVQRAMRRHGARAADEAGAAERAPGEAYGGEVVAALNGSGAATSLPDVPVPGGLIPQPLVLSVLDPAAATGGQAGGRDTAPADEPRDAWLATRGPWLTALVYGLGGVAQAALSATIWFAATGIPPAPIRTTVVIWLLAWPVVYTTDMVTGGRRRLLSLAIYVAVPPALLLLSGQPENILPLLLAWLLMAGAPTVVLLVLLYRRWRAVGPLVYVVMLTGAIGAVLGFAFVGTDVGTSAILQLAMATNAPIVPLYYGVQLLAFLLGALASWLLLRGVSRLYAAKLISDQSLIADAIWLTFCLNLALDLANESTGWAAAGLVVFPVYKTVTAIGFALLRRARGTVAGHRLLFLRVFGSSKRSEQLMRLVGARWRHAGPIQLIGATDLAASTLEPHDVLEFVRGKLANRYINGRERLDRQCAAMDLAADADGRFRVNEFLCHDDTWQMTLLRLVTANDAVLMDLRAFAPSNQGCVFELRELVDTVPLSRVALVVDETTDMPFLEAVLRAAWEAMAAGSPNRRLNPAQATAYRLTGNGGAGAGALIAGIARASAAGGPAAEMASDRTPAVALGASA